MSYTYDEIYDNICRLCFSNNKSDNMVNLIDDSKKLTHYAKAVMKLTNIIISDDDLPRKMCSVCLFLLKQTILFKQKCESTNHEFGNLKSLSNSLEDLKETAVQHWMYQLYFPNELDNKISQETNSSNLDTKPVLKCERKSTQPNTISDMTDNVTIYTEVNNKDNTDYLLDVIENKFTTQDQTLNDHQRKSIKKETKKKIKRQTNKPNSLECKICKKVLANRLTYKQHMQRHTGCDYICEHCGKGFPVKWELNTHTVSLHSTGVYLQCQHCPFKAARKFDLVEHIRVHTGERPFTCEKCGLTFRTRCVWKRHLKYHKGKNVQCTQCPRKFHQRSDMLAHCNNVHDRLYVYLCNKCGITYAKLATLRRHLTERHGIPREQQSKMLRVKKASITL